MESVFHSSMAASIPYEELSLEALLRFFTFTTADLGTLDPSHITVRHTPSLFCRWSSSLVFAPSD